VDHDILIGKVMNRIADGYVIKLIREWLRSGIVFQRNTSYPVEGTPQGGVISPLLANIYLNTHVGNVLSIGAVSLYTHPRLSLMICNSRIVIGVPSITLSVLSTS
ncbi:MAG: hypothetical protein ACP5UZ_09005, partial [Thermoplasmata archaeon]